MTKPQLQSIHIFRRKLEALSAGHFDRGQFDLLLINLGGVRPDAEGRISSKALENRGFERVMTYLEEAIYVLDQTVGTYWHDRDARRGDFLSPSQEWEIKRLFDLLASAGVEYALAGLLDRQTQGRTSEPRELRPDEARALIETLKGIADRQAKTRLDHGRQHVEAYR